MAKTLRAGDNAPDITLPDQDGKSHKLSDRRGKWVLVYFYPRDDTPGCTVEACGLRDAASQYAQHGVDVFGVSADSVKSHKKFAQKFDLPFTLLADEEKSAIHSFGVWGRKKFMGREFDGILRQSFLIDPQGRIAKIYPKVKPAEHAEEVLADVRSLSSGEVPAAAPAKKTAARKKKPAAKAKVKAAAKRSKPRSAPKRSKSK